MKTLVAIVFISTFLHAVSGLSCFQCNSHKDVGCMDAKKSFNEECGTDDDGKEYTVCRKIYMHLEMDVGKYHPAEERVHRDCGHLGMEDPEKNCYYKSGYNTRSFVCHCDSDGCNAAGQIAPTLAALLPIAVVAALRGMF
ncbi:unnamed protein product [Meganyctiphanes norvegica]|uniref:Protein sleepless n=1 Tax=Meganyctiphanes norvegica TaxID=48144 RepID=A0AAV2RAZ1_MEGNR